MPKRSEPGKGACAGSVTLFLALTLTIVLSLFFSLLEAVRVQGLSMIAQRNLKLSLTSAFGAYHMPLWRDYRLLFLDGGDWEGQFNLSALEGRMVKEDALKQRGSSFYQIALKNIEVTKYGLASDHGGIPFRIQACKAIKEQLALDTVESLKEKLESGGKLAEDRKELGEKWDTAQNAESEAKSWKEGKEETEEGEKPGIMEGHGTVPVDKLPKNPMDFVKVWKKSPMLALIVENPSAISGKGISLDGSMGKRKKEKGNLVEKGTESLEKLWLGQYLNYYLSCQNGAGTGGSKNHVLDYELEYCIGGKATDRENLEQTVKELLLIREAGNFMAIMKDEKKKALALEMAAAAAGFTGIAPLVQAVQIGILLAWSYMESVLDVRCLLAGGKIPLVKEPSEWKSDIFSGEKVLGQKTEKEETGLSYREYLQILLLTIQEETLAYRAMDIIEQNIRMEPGEGQFRMDYVIYGMEAEALYQSNILFLGFVAGVKEKGGAYYFNSKEQLFYSREQ